MNPYVEAGKLGIAFCWCCTKNQLLAEFGLRPMSKWKLAVMKHRYEELLK